MKADLKVFTRGDDALAFMTELGPLWIIGITESEKEITVWYWERSRHEP